MMLHVHGIHSLQLLGLLSAISQRSGAAAGGATDQAPATEPPTTQYPAPDGDCGCPGQKFAMPKDAADNLISSLVALGLDDARITVTGPDGKEYAVIVYVEEKKPAA